MMHCDGLCCAFQFLIQIHEVSTHTARKQFVLIFVELLEKFLLKLSATTCYSLYAVIDDFAQTALK